LAWNATHGRPRDESAIFFTGDENLVELGGVVEYRYSDAGLPGVLFNVADVENTVLSTSEGVFREVVGCTTLESLMQSGRREFEATLGRILQERLTASGLPVVVERVWVVDAHPPREVVPAYRDVASAVYDAERANNQAQADAARLTYGAQAEAEAIRDTARTQACRLASQAAGASAAFLARAASHTAAPALTEFRLLWDTLAEILPGRPKLILDRRSAGRRHVWFADPEQSSPSLGRALAPFSNDARNSEPDD
jgi:regulator of protease activity HflC (stomatin/prohibitin superfamily)